MKVPSKAKKKLFALDVIRFRLSRARMIHLRTKPMFQAWDKQWVSYTRKSGILNKAEREAKRIREVQGLVKSAIPMEKGMAIALDDFGAWLDDRVLFPFDTPKTTTKRIHDGLVKTAEKYAPFPKRGLGLAVSLSLQDPAYAAILEGRDNLITVGTAKTRFEQIKTTIRDEFIRHGRNAEEVRRALLPVFRDAYRNQGLLIARTEVHHIIGKANFETFKANGFEFKSWYCAGNKPCDVCLGRWAEGTIPFGDAWGDGAMDAGDSHPNCFCMIVPENQGATPLHPVAFEGIEVPDAALERGYWERVAV